MRSILVAAASILCATSAQSVAAEPAQVSSNAPCLLNFGATGPQTTDDRVNKVWSTIDHIVSTSITSILTGDGYAVRHHEGTAQGHDQRLAEAIEQMHETGCAKALQVGRNWHNHDGIMDLSFAVLIFHVDAQRKGASTQYSVAGDYSKTYDFHLDKEQLGALSPSAIAKQIATDIEASKVLEPMKVASAPATEH
jgi:hypothetical protein